MSLERTKCLHFFHFFRWIKELKETKMAMEMEFQCSSCQYDVKNFYKESSFLEEEKYEAEVEKCTHQMYCIACGLFS